MSSNAIIASAPAVATGIATGTSSALSGIPLIGSWLAGSSAVTSGASAAATTATATAATAATGLGVILFPISIMAAGFAIYSGYKRWSDIKDKEKQNLIEHAVGTIDKVCLQVLDRIKKNKKNCNAILNTFNQDLDSKIREAEDKVAELLENRPSVSEISALERKHDTLARLEKN